MMTGGNNKQMKGDYMKYLKQFLYIIGITFIGELCHQYIPLPIPASIYGIIILFTLLCFKVLKLEDVEETGQFLISIMAVMFIPAAVGIMNSWTLISNNVIPYTILIIVTTIIVMVVTGVITQVLVGKDGK